MAFIKTDNIKGDVFGGITAGIVALPLALAFGIQAFGGIDDPAASSMGALAGLVGATFLGFFASLFGGTHSQISGPTGPMTVITASLLSGVWAAQHSMSAVLISMSLAGLFCGLFQILFGIPTPSARTSWVFRSCAKASRTSSPGSKSCWPI